MPILEAPSFELGSVPQTPNMIASPTVSSSEVSSASSPEPPRIRPTPLFRALAMAPPEPDQPPGQEELERRLPGYRRIVIPREFTLIELLKESSGARTDEEVLRIREAKLKVVAERVGLRRLDVLAPRLRSLTLDGSAISSLRDLGIGLVHLKVLSVNRCGLHSLDGVWGLGALREFSAAGNRLRDLQALGALQKLHTLNLADNPIEEADRLWTLGVCGSLRRLTLQGTPASDTPFYRRQVATALPMLVYLDDLPMHTDIDFSDVEFFAAPDSGESDVEIDLPKEEPPAADPVPGSSDGHAQFDTEPPDRSKEDVGSLHDSAARMRHFRRRPATTENAGVRPRVELPRRPHTALERKIEAPTRLHILNTLMDEEWRCSGSKLTSHGAVCGNLAHALRRSRTPSLHHSVDSGSMIQENLADAARAIAAEIPRAPGSADWITFKAETGIDIDIDFDALPNELDSSKAMERLEQIEKETLERFRSGDDATTSRHTYAPINFTSIMNDFEQWKANITPSPPRDVDSLFADLNIIERNLDSFTDNSESRSG